MAERSPGPPGALWRFRGLFARAPRPSHTRPVRWATSLKLGVLSAACSLACAHRGEKQTSDSPTETPETVRPSGADDLAAEPDAGPGDPLVTATRPQGGIFRSELDLALSRGPGYLLYELGPEPFRVSGKFVGWEITRVFPDEPRLCADGCDLEVGDVILSVNGDRIETPQALSDLLETLPKADALVVKSLRDEKRRVVTYPLVEG